MKLHTSRNFTGLSCVCAAHRLSDVAVSGGQERLREGKRKNLCILLLKNKIDAIFHFNQGKINAILFIWPFLSFETNKKFYGELVGGGEK